MGDPLPWAQFLLACWPLWLIVAAVAVAAWVER